jgi:hypothetical protein
VEALRRSLARLAWILDSSIPIPGLGWRIGVEALLGLVPGVGDALGVGLSAWIVFQAWRLGVPRGVLARMLGNVALEAAVGVVPVLGDLFDMGWKANVRNVRLLEAHLVRPRRAALEGRLFVVAVLAALAGLVLLSLALGFALGRLLLADPAQ